MPIAGKSRLNWLCAVSRLSRLTAPALAITVLYGLRGIKFSIDGVPSATGIAAFSAGSSSATAQAIKAGAWPFVNSGLENGFLVAAVQVSLP